MNNGGGGKLFGVFLLGGAMSYPFVSVCVYFVTDLLVSLYGCFQK